MSNVFPDMICMLAIQATIWPCGYMQTAYLLSGNLIFNVMLHFVHNPYSLSLPKENGKHDYILYSNTKQKHCRIKHSVSQMLWSNSTLFPSSITTAWPAIPQGTRKSSVFSALTPTGTSSGPYLNCLNDGRLKTSLGFPKIFVLAWGFVNVAWKALL